MNCALDLSGLSLITSRVGVTSLNDAAWIQPSKESIRISVHFSGIVVTSLQYNLKCLQREIN